MDYRLGDWNKLRLSELDRAKALIADKNNSLIEISKRIDIPYQTLKNYRADIAKLNTASWSRVNKLAKLYDAYQVVDNMTSDEVTEVGIKIHKYFDRMRRQKSNTSRDMDAINIMEDVVCADTIAEYEIFKALKGK